MLGITQQKEEIRRTRKRDVRDIGGGGKIKKTEK